MTDDPPTYKKWLPSYHSVSGRIAIGFAIVLALHLSIAGLGHYGLNKADRDLQTQEDIRLQVELFYQIDRTVGDLQRNVLFFAFTGFRGLEMRAEQLHIQLEELLQQASCASNSVPANEELLADMQSHLRRHREIFAAVIADRAKRRQLLDGELKKYGIEFNDFITNQTKTSAGLLVAEADFNFAQYQVMEFAINPDSVHVRNVKKRLAKIRHELTGELTLPAHELLTIVKRYESAFIQMVQATRGYLHLVNVVLAGEAEELSLLASKARENYAQQAHDLTENMQAANARFHSASNKFSILTIVLGIFASWFIGKTVAPPLNAITQTIDGLSKGQECQKIPGLERKDELGKLAAAAQVFKNKAAETTRLLDEVTRMKELERQHAHDQKLESLGELAAGIAHEINTPIQCVATNVEYMEHSCEFMISLIDDFSELFAHDHIENLEEFAKVRNTLSDRRFAATRNQVPNAITEASIAVNRVIEIVRAMKSMSHPGSINLQPTDINELIRNAAIVARNRWKYVAELEFDLDENMPLVDAMSSELSQVILNLLVNAADAIAEGDLSEAGTIWIRTRAEGEMARIEVQDTGMGIPEKVRDKIFEPFFTTKEVGKGTGQGLAVSYDVVTRRHNGTIDLDSEEGKGTTFIIHIPIAQAATKEEAELLATT